MNETDLKWRIAEARGHKIECRPMGKRWHASVYYEGSVVIDGELDTEDLARRAIEHALPDYTGSVDVALSLPVNYDEWFWTLMPCDSHGYANARLHPYDMSKSAVGAHALESNLALAMCRAWLQWQESKP